MKPKPASSAKRTSAPPCSPSRLISDCQQQRRGPTRGRAFGVVGAAGDASGGHFVETRALPWTRLRPRALGNPIGACAPPCGSRGECVLADGWWSEAVRRPQIFGLLDPALRDGIKPTESLRIVPKPSWVVGRSWKMLSGRLLGQGERTGGERRVSASLMKNRLGRKCG